ncbi:hypothetical protein AX14_002079 [Amanita brunnescens Koide BX004]|nr:hypothetical protein AX14_002079 [Amanita brunnescens Koide BX004]
MCHNVIDGRYHTECGHFYAMNTRQHDCRQPNCLFSDQHVHTTGCSSPLCIRLMAVPVKNPIRISTMVCCDCTAKEHVENRKMSLHMD